VQWSSESQAQPTTRASSSAHPPQRRDPAVDLVDLRGHAHPQRLRRRADRARLGEYSAISPSVNPTACASLIARRNRTVSSS
jgi:hypothetical protein